MIGHNAVVMGTSMAGLCAARVLSERFERIARRGPVQGSVELPGEAESSPRAGVSPPPG
jgi:hypothetical protein